jgi:tRNA (Thr-GGU) A37 N-methylase
LALDASPKTPLTEGGDEQNQRSGSMEVRPIGVLRSSFRKRFGTPRQGSVVSAGRAILKMHQSVNPVMSTTNLGDFSHVW